jgi:hypothetical protein
MDTSGNNGTLLEKFSPSVYSRYPVLDQILLDYLGMEEIVQRWKLEPDVFETRQFLASIANRFHLPQATSFKSLLRAYDTEYPTTRSYFIPGLYPDQIMFRAAEAGNLQAFYDGLKLYPKYKVPRFLNSALKHAARGGHQVMIDLVKDLGATNLDQEVIGTIEGGHLVKLKAMFKGLTLNKPKLIGYSASAIRKGQLEVLKYLTGLWVPSLEEWNNLLYRAGHSGHIPVTDYLISQGANDYTELVMGGIIGGNPNLVMEYLDRPGIDYNAVFKTALSVNNLVLAKRVAQGRNLGRDFYNVLLNELPESTTFDTIDLLISLDGDDYTGLLLALIENHPNDLEGFKRYYRGPGIDYEAIFSYALIKVSLVIANYMIKKRLVKSDPEGLNSYLKYTRLNVYVIELLFSLGANDYDYVVKEALRRGDTSIFKQYFNRSSLEVNQAFGMTQSLELYKYLAGVGELTQATLDAKLTELNQYKSHVQEKKYLIGLGAKPLAA